MHTRLQRARFAAKQRPLNQSTRSQNMNAREFVKESQQFQTPYQVMLRVPAPAGACAVCCPPGLSCSQLLRNPSRFPGGDFWDRANGVVMRFQRDDPPGSILEGGGIPWGRREGEGPSWAFYAVLGPVDRLARVCWGIQLDFGCHAYTVDRRAGVCSWHRSLFDVVFCPLGEHPKAAPGPPGGGEQEFRNRDT